MEDVPSLFKKTRSQSVQIFGYVFHDAHGPNHGQTLKIPWYLSNEICTVTHSQASCGKDNSRKFCWSSNGKKYRIECVFVHRKQGLFLSVYVDYIKMAGKKQNMAPTWKKLMKQVDLDEPNSFLHHENLGTHSKWMSNRTKESSMDTEKRSNHEFLLEQLKKLPGWEKPHAKNGCVVVWHGRTCSKNARTGVGQTCSIRHHVDNCNSKWMSNRTKESSMDTEKRSNHEFLLEQLKKLPGWEKPHAKNGCVVVWHGRTCSKNARTGVGQTCSIRHHVDNCMWTTTGTLDLLHSSRKIVTDCFLSCGKNGSALSTGSVPRLWFCWGPWGFKINLGRNPMHLWKSDICSYKLDV